MREPCRIPRAGALLLLGAAALISWGGCRTVDQALNRARVPCGFYRWRIKTLSDPDAQAIRWQPIDARIRDLVAMSPPAWFDRRKRNSNEYYTYRVRAVVLKVRVNLDQDLHLLLRDPEDPKARMVAEIPNPGCARATGRPSFLAAARRTAQGLRHRHRETLVEIVGVGFFDEFHEPHGGSPNGFELHPVFGIRELNPSAEQTQAFASP
jgi:hypothetical protein